MSERNHDEWEHLRTRVDSLANAIFLISGGALSVSISVMISAKKSDVITQNTSEIATCGWYGLLAAIVLFLILKMHMIAHAFLLQEKTEFLDANRKWINKLGWLWGVAGFSSFIYGLVQLVQAASCIVAN